MPEQRSGMAGATPAGAADERSAAEAVQRMFDEIAPRYDLLNHTLSLSIDRLWWRRTARTFAHVLQRPEALIIDLCAGTGDMSAALRRAAIRERGLPRIVGIDFSHSMLTHGLEKFERCDVAPVEADALRMPLPSGAADLVVSAFGFRNIANYDQALREIHRVLKPGGEVGILDFSEPRGAFGSLYRVYFQRVLPRIGAWISGVRSAYEYLPASVKRFPAPEVLVDRMQQLGFESVAWKPYSFGIAGLCRGIRT